MIIDQLPEISTVQDTDEIPIERGTTTYKTPLSKIWARLTAAFGSNVLPNMDGTAAIGSSDKYARADHVHPHDNLIVRPNLLDNWYFAGGGSQIGFGVFPVNQRLQTNYSTTNAFCFDRWKLTSGTVTLDSNGIVLNGTIVQTLPQSIGLSTVASALLSDGTMITPIYNDSTRTFTLTASNKTIVAVKLEIGDTQTLAHEENDAWVLNEIPSYSAELDKCQHYLYPVLADNESNGALVGGYAHSNTSIRISLPGPRLARYGPSIVFLSGSASSLKLVSDSGTLTPTAISAFSFSRSSAVLLIFTVSGATTNKTYWLNSIDADFLLSAEL